MADLLEMKFYRVDTNYLNNLRLSDNRVPLNKEYIGSSKRTRPYIGIMLVIDGIDYLVPLTSKTKRRTSYVNMPIFDKNNKKIAYLLINNMIPVPESYRTPINMEGILSTDPAYYDLLMNEINDLRPKKETIKKRCDDVRAVKVKGEVREAINDKTANYCLNLIELEKIYICNSKK